MNLRPDRPAPEPRPSPDGQDLYYGVGNTQKGVPARGILRGLMISLVLWGAMAAIVIAVLRVRRSAD